MSEITSVRAAHKSSDSILDELVDEFARALQSGVAVDAAEFACRHPECKDKLLRVLPAMQLLAEFRGSGAADQPSPNSAEGGSAPAAGMLGDFRILGEIGRGGMGVVYEAEQISLGRRVALKVLPFAATMDPKQLLRFKNEAQAAAQLHHTNIVPVFGVGCERGVHYYAMQFIEGQTLAGVIADMRRQHAAGSEDLAPALAETVERQPAGLVSQRPDSKLRSPLAPTQPIAALSTEHSLQSTAYFRTVAKLGAQAAEALEYAHDHGVIHRDIKPANLLVDARANLWITDFGLAHCQNQAGLTMSGDLVGTLRYMSPEQALAKRVIVDHRTDIYSLGATLYELLTGEPVFPGADRQELLRQIAFEEPRSLRRPNKPIPADLETIVLKAMEKNPADRYATAQEMAEDLERFMRDESILAKRPPLRRRLGRWCRRHKAPVTGVVVLVVTATLLGSAFLWSRQRERAAAEQGVAKDLEEAEIWQKQEQWGKALEALERADGRLSVLGSSTLAIQVNERRRQAALIAQLADARMVASGLHSGMGNDYPAADRAYAKAFADHGLDIAARPAEEIAREISALPIRLQLVTALDYWSYVKRMLPKEEPERVLAVARLADNDEWRQDLRDARMGKDPKAFERLAEDPTILSQPPVNLMLLSFRLDNAKAGALLRRAQNRYPGDFWIHVELAGRLFQDPAAQAERLGCLRTAAALQPRKTAVLINLGSALEKQKQYGDAIAVYQTAIDTNPTMAAYHCLGKVLQSQKRLPEAVAAYQKSIELDPHYGFSRLFLGDVLMQQKKPAEAEEVYRGAVAVAEELLRKRIYGFPVTDVYLRLADALEAQRKLPDAVTVLRQYIAEEPLDAFGYRRLGDVLIDQDKPIEAEQAYRDAATRRPEYAKAFFGLGRALKNQNKPADATTWFHKAGDTFARAGRLDEAEPAYRKALAIEPDRAQAYLGIANVLKQQHKSSEVIEALRSAIAHQPKFGKAHWNLGMALIKQGQFVESLASLKRGLELGARLPAADQQIRRVEGFIALEPKLGKYLTREIEPASAAERIALAELCCVDTHRRYAAAAGFYADAFAGDLKLADESNRYNAACAAALAGCRQGKDGVVRDDKECARLLNQAHAWFQAVVEHWQAELSRDPKRGPGYVRYRAQWWKTDPDLSGVRDPDAFAKLPEAERQKWQKLWQDVEELRMRANQPKK